MLYIYMSLKNTKRVSVANEVVKYNYNKTNENSLVSSGVSERSIDTLKVGEVIFQDAKDDHVIGPYAELFKIANACGFVEMAMDSKNVILQKACQDALKEIKHYSLMKNKNYLTRRKMIRIGLMKFSPQLYTVVRSIMMRLENKES